MIIYKRVLIFNGDNLRADRLLSILTMLQTHGTLTAGELAQKLAVTERTIYRDVIALSAAGVPIYTIKGPGGGIGLVEEFRSGLIGLKPNEVEALFMLEIPQTLEQLGVGETIRKAFLKLSATLPDSKKKTETKTHPKIMMDALDWNQTQETVPWLKTCQEALQKNRMLEIIYRSEFNTNLEIVADPIGLVAKSQRWYLVILRGEHYRTLQVSRIRSARIRNQSFEYPHVFDLATYWKKWCSEQKENHTGYQIQVRVTANLAKILSDHRPVTLMTPPMQDNSPWQELTLEYESFEEARRMVLSYGGAIEVLEPLALRRSVQDFAKQIAKLYS
jgi:predicted DNA-binding transcriptional regulator YafY